MSCWLMKAEPDSRIVKGKDVKFSIDDLKEMGTSQWDGVRSHEAKKIMKEKMKLGQKVLFYHSNTKVPGVYGLAEISKEGYPDWSAWDPRHPYYDPKSSETEPTWFMVDVTYTSHLLHPPTLHLIKSLASLSSLPPSVDYIGEEGWKEIKEMALINRGRLSVQPVTEGAYDAIVKLGMKGGWESLVESGKGKAKGKGMGKGKGKENDVANGVKEGKEGIVKGNRAKTEQEDDDDEESSLSPLPAVKKPKPAAVKRKSGGTTKTEVDGDDASVRRSKRSKKT